MNVTCYCGNSYWLDKSMGASCSNCGCMIIRNSKGVVEFTPVIINCNSLLTVELHKLNMKKDD